MERRGREILTDDHVLNTLVVLDASQGFLDIRLKTKEKRKKSEERRKQKKAKKSKRNKRTIIRMRHIRARLAIDKQHGRKE
jgi:hypothetical protein